MTQQPVMDRLAPRETQKNINIEFLKPWPIILPSISEQDEIVDSLKAVDAKIKLSVRKRSEIQDLFRTLLHKMMTAQVRVDEIDLPELDVMQ